MDAPWRYRDYPNADRIVQKKCAMALEHLLTIPPSDAANEVKDTRNIHRTIFEGLVDDERKQFAGHYRGENLPYLENRTGSRCIQIFQRLHVSHRFVRPENVLLAMQQLEHRIDLLFTSLATVSKAERYKLAVEILVQFYLIHPYVDGNGHIGRILMTYLMRIVDIPIHRSWAIHPSPFTNAIGICLFTYTRHPVIAEQYFRQWFSVPVNPISLKSDPASHCDAYGPENCAAYDGSTSTSPDSGSSGSSSSQSDSSESDSTDSDSSDSGSSESSSSESDCSDPISSNPESCRSSSENTTPVRRKTRSRERANHYPYSEEEYMLHQS